MRTFEELCEIIAMEVQEEVEAKYDGYVTHHDAYVIAKRAAKKYVRQFIKLKESKIAK